MNFQKTTLSIVIVFFLGFFTFRKIQVSPQPTKYVAAGGLQRPDCGTLDDHKIHIPPDWNAFDLPNLGSSYVDPVFGCRVTRLTNGTEEHGRNDKALGLMNYYSTFSAVNATDSMVMLTADDGSWLVEKLTGNVVVEPSGMPTMNDGHPVWDASNGSIFYYAVGNKLDQGAISGKSVKSTMLHEFGEYQGVASPDAADLSQDGQHIALIGQNKDRTMDIFVWSLKQKKKTSSYTTQCWAGKWNVTETPQPGCVHKIQMTPRNLLTIQFATDGSGPEQGLRLWDGERLVPLQDHTNHYDTGYDLNGAAVFIEIGGSHVLSGQRNSCSSNWGLEVRQLRDLSAATCLLDKQPALHVSYRGSESQPWAVLSFFDERKAGPELFSDDSGFHQPSKSNWALYEDEIVLTRIDGSAMYRLAHARSRSAEGYWDQPHAAISRDGKYIVFTSNMAHPNGCPAAMQVPNECTDVYLIKVF